MALIIFDFDETLCNVSVYRMNITLNDILPSGIMFRHELLSYESLFNSYYELRKILNYLKANGNQLAIISLNYNTIIYKILNFAFPNIFEYDDIITTDNFAQIATQLELSDIPPTNGRYVIDNEGTTIHFGNKTISYSKNYMISILTTKYKIDSSNVYFYDDDKNNIVNSIQLSINAHHCKKGSFCSRTLFETLSKELLSEYPVSELNKIQSVKINID